MTCSREPCRFCGWLNSVYYAGDAVCGSPRAVEPANVDLDIARLDRARGERDARCQRDDIATGLRAGLLQRLGREGRNRGRHIAQPLVRPPSGYDDLALVVRFWKGGQNGRAHV